MSYSITTHMYDYMNDGENFIKVLVSYSELVLINKEK